MELSRLDTIFAQFTKNSYLKKIKKLYLQVNSLTEFNISHKNIICLRIDRDIIKNVYNLPPDLREPHFIPICN